LRAADERLRAAHVAVARYEATALANARAADETRRAGLIAAAKCWSEWRDAQERLIAANDEAAARCAATECIGTRILVQRQTGGCSRIQVA